MENLIFIFLAASVGIFVVLNEKFPKGKEKIRAGETLPEKTQVTPMTLRNGYGVTKDKNPTFAEQWVNIMNYNGESQREEGYEEDYPEGNLG